MRRIVALGLALAVSLTARTATAQVPQSGGLGIYFTPIPGGTWDAVITVLPFESFDIFVLSYSVPGGMEAYEFGVQMPAGAIVSGGRLLPVGSNDFGAGDDNWIVGTGGICQGADGWFTLVKYAATLFLAPVPNDTYVCLVGATPSSFQDGLPGYLVCASPGNLQSFAPAYFGCAVLNCVATYLCQPDPIGDTTFGALKAGY